MHERMMFEMLGLGNFYDISRELETPTLNYYFKSITLPFGLCKYMKDSRKKLGYKDVWK